MNTEQALEYLKDIMGETDNRLEELCKLLIWSYESGWEEGRQDYREDLYPTDDLEWRRTR